MIGTLLLPVGLGLLIAVVSYDLKAAALYRLPFLLPYALSGTAIATVWQFMLTRDGALNSVLNAVGLESLARSWLLRPPLNTYAMIVASTWQAVGVSVLLFLIGLQVIPKDPIEAARLDGAEGWRLFRDMTFPLLRPMTVVTVGISLVNCLKTFDIIWIMTQGGPYRSSETLAVTMYCADIRPLRSRLRRGDRRRPERDRLVMSLLYLPALDEGRVMRSAGLVGSPHRSARPGRGLDRAALPVPDQCRDLVRRVRATRSGGSRRASLRSRDNIRPPGKRPS